MIIVTTLDNEYVQHYSVMLTSLAFNSNMEGKVKIFAIAPQLSSSNKMIIKQYTSSLGLDFEFLAFDDKLVNDFFISDHISLAAYYRIYISEILPHENKAIYLDSDTIIKGDLKELWKYDLNDNVVGAVCDPDGSYRKSALDIPDEYSYFNSGVMILNLQKWRDLNFTTKLVQFIQENPEKLKYHDQDALNALLYDKTLIIDDFWNVQTSMFNLNMRCEIPEYEVAIQHPRIIHYTTASKPWHFTNNHIYKEQYYFYLSFTPFKEFRPLKKETELLLRKEYIFIFGAGIFGERFQHILEINLTSYLDNNPQKWGDLKNQTIIRNPNFLYEFPKNKVGIIVVSVHATEICNQLMKMGFMENEHYVAQM